MLTSEWPHNPMYLGFFTGEPATSAAINGFLFRGLEGWRKPITELVEDLYMLGWDGHLLQIKEKFGGLRFYIADGTDAIDKRIREAELECDKTCMLCGAPGGVRSINRWLSTLCHECHNLENPGVEYAGTISE